MAQITTNVDDLTGETLPAGTPTTTITITDSRWSEEVGETFELDLSDTSFKSLVTALRKFSGKARPVTIGRSLRTALDATEAADARAWAIANRPDLNVKAVGAVPARALEAYRDHLNATDTAE